VAEALLHAEASVTVTVHRYPFTAPVAAVNLADSITITCGTVQVDVGITDAQRKGGMSVEARKAEGERMKAYWAAKRARKVNGPGDGTQVETASQNGAPSHKPGRKVGRKQRQKR
jgi:hypothetical protein